MFRLYREEVPGFTGVRFGRPYSTLEKACSVAVKVTNAVFEVRRILPNGQELLVDVVREGRRVAA